MGKRVRDATSILLIALAQAPVACVAERNPPQVTPTSDSTPGAVAPQAHVESDATDRASMPSAHVCRPGHAGIVTVRDTTNYENDTGGGRVGILYLGDAFIDSVDIDFGVQPVGRDSLLFLPVIGDDIDDHVLYDRASCVKLATKLPYLDSYFSSPSVARSLLRYWGLKKLSESAYAVYAMRFDFGRSHLDSLPLDTLDLRTDYRFYFAAPKDVADGVEYKGQASVYVVDSSYTRVARKTTVVPPAT